MHYFTLHELTRSSMAESYIIKNIPSTDEIVALNALVDNILDPARTAIGQPIIVTSGYRCPELNKRVGGVATSQHTRGEAADITLKNRNNNLLLARTIYELGTFDQLILESADRRATQCDWIHVSYSRTGNRHQTLIKYRNAQGYKPYKFD